MTPESLSDPVPLAQALIRCPSVTPADEGAQGVLAEALALLGFTCQRLTFQAEGTAPVENLFAHRAMGGGGPCFAFAGHTDVVPAGDASAWTHQPFAAALTPDGHLLGRGAVDMKGAIACFVAAVARYLQGTPAPGRIALLITGDEEGIGINGTPALLDWMRREGHTIDACLVGEPTSLTTIGDVVKIGRRGTLTARLRVAGVQGHSAYPHLADNPVHHLVRLVQHWLNTPLDAGTDTFEPSTLQVTSLDVGNGAANVIPGEAHALLNIRFNPLHSGASLTRWLRRSAAAHLPEGYRLDVTVGGEPFLTAPGPFTQCLADAMSSLGGPTPEFTTGGGTSDARFIRAMAPVAELGLRSQTMHQIEERVPMADLQRLTSLYTAILERWFADGGPR